MTQIGKLYAQLLAGRPLSFAEFERRLRAFGFRPDRIITEQHGVTPGDSE